MNATKSNKIKQKIKQKIKIKIKRNENNFL